MNSLVRSIALVPCLTLFFVPAVLAGVNKEIETEYKGRFENKALFLKLPIRGQGQVIYLRGDRTVLDQSSLGAGLLFKVGEQVRVVELDFSDRQVKFKLASVDLARRAEITFDFGESLSYTFYQRPAFDQALQETFTEGLTYKEIDSAKQQYLQDQFERTLRQFSETTGADEDFVKRAVLSKVPDFERLRTELEQARGQLAGLESQLGEERSAREKSEAELRDLRRSLTEANRSSESVRQERETLARDRSRLEQEVNQLREENRSFQAQVQSIASKLDVEVDSRSQLSNQVGSLTRNIDNLSAERIRLAARADELRKEVGDVTMERDRLAGDLSAVQRRLGALQRDLSTLTSNREGLEATYLRTKEAKEKLELADRLAEALRLKPSSNQDGGVESAEILLLSQIVGSVQLDRPLQGGQLVRLQIEVASPNTVQFSEEERRLYEALGGSIRFQPAWNSSFGQLRMDLQSGEQAQSIAPRERGEWTWFVHGEPPDTLVLDLDLLDTNESQVRVSELQFRLESGGIIPGGISLFSVLIGFSLGAVLIGGASLAVRGKRSREIPRQRRTYGAEKQL